MREKAIRKLIEIVEESEIDILEVNTWWRRIKITRRQSQNGSAPAHNNGNHPEQAYLDSQPAPPLAQQPAPAPTPAQTAAPEVAPSKLVEIKSPMVGTFYTAPSPDSQPYVKVGDSVSVGSVVCIVEAMKLMNEIESEVSGKIVKALVENAQPVEFGQPLFQIDPSA